MEEETNAGRALVRDILIRRLAAAGLKRPKAQTEAAFAEWTDRIVQRLAYMSPENLEVLADLCLSHAAQNASTWPLPVLIVGWAEGLQARPWAMAPIVSSWLASVEGPKALAGGYLVQLYRHLRAHPRPPAPFDVTRIREQAAADQRAIGLIRERIERGAAPDDQRRWLSDFLTDEQAARTLVDAGDRARAEKQRDSQNGEAA